MIQSALVGPTMCHNCEFPEVYFASTKQAFLHSWQKVFTILLPDDCLWRRQIYFRRQKLFRFQRLGHRVRQPLLRLHRGSGVELTGGHRLEHFLL